MRQVGVCAHSLRGGCWIPDYELREQGGNQGITDDNGGGGPRGGGFVL
jgi:hypothetical protein